MNFEELVSAAESGAEVFATIGVPGKEGKEPKNLVGQILSVHENGTWVFFPEISTRKYFYSQKVREGLHTIEELSAESPKGKKFSTLVGPLPDKSKTKKKKKEDPAVEFDFLEKTVTSVPAPLPEQLVYLAANYELKENEVYDESGNVFSANGETWVYVGTIAPVL